MLNLLKKTYKETIVFSPVNGNMIALEMIPDPVFSSGMMGKGCGFIFNGDTIYAPCDGEVITIANTLHAIGIKSRNHMEILIHIGMDTVELNGNGFEVYVSQKENIRCGQPLIKIDRNIMDKHNINLTTPLVITNSDDFDIEFYEHKDTVYAKTSEIFIARKR